MARRIPGPAAAAATAPLRLHAGTAPARRRGTTGDTAGPYRGVRDRWSPLKTPLETVERWAGRRPGGGYGGVTGLPGEAAGAGREGRIGWEMCAECVPFSMAAALRIRSTDPLVRSRASDWGRASDTHAASTGSILCVVQTRASYMAEEPRVRQSALPGLLVAGGVVSGLAGLVCGFLASLRGDLVAGGIGFAAGAIAFGLLASAVLRE